MKFSRILRAILVIYTIAVSRSPAAATQLIFEQVRNGGAVYSAFNDGVVPQDYGDRVTGVSQSVSGGIFTYGNLGEGFTPNVEISYGPYYESANVWFDGFGDLKHAVWTGVYTPIEIKLTADPGFLVSLHDFDLAGWWNWDYTIGSLQILDGSGNLLVDQTDVHVEGDFNGSRHSHFEFGELQAPTLVLRIDTTNLLAYFYNVGIDNLRFSQSEAGPSRGPSAVPEPSAGLLLAAGCFGVKLFRLRKK